MSELADGVLLSRSGLTRLVDRMERDGLLRRERCEDDARGFNALDHRRGPRPVPERPAHPPRRRARAVPQPPLRRRAADARAAVGEGGAGRRGLGGPAGQPGAGQHERRAAERGRVQDLVAQRGAEQDRHDRDEVDRDRPARGARRCRSARRTSRTRDPSRARRGRPRRAGWGRRTSELGMPAIAAGRTSTTATSCARQITGSAPWRRWSGAVRLKAIPYRNAATSTSADAERVRAVAHRRDADRHDAGEAEQQPGALEARRQLAHGQRGHEGHHQRRGRVDHPRQRGVDPLLSDGEQHERDRHPGDADERDLRPVRARHRRRATPAPATASARRRRSGRTPPAWATGGRGRCRSAGTSRPR